MRLLELYTTVQGEGPNVGKPTTFVRFAGCNMRCPGWPCDTPYSIFPDQWKKEYEDIRPPDLMNRVLHEVPRHVCITGGEPLIQNMKEMKIFQALLLGANFTVDIFTNGSRDFIDYDVLRPNTTIIQDWKLPGSGEGSNFLPQRELNLTHLREQDAVKLVCKDFDDLEAAERFIKGHADRPEFRFRTYVGAAWGLLKESTLVSWMDQKGFKDVYLNTQVHKYIFNPEMRRI